MSTIQSNKYEILPRGSKIIRVDYNEDQHKQFLTDPQSFKNFLDEQISNHPELFPSEIVNGYAFHGKGRASKKLDNIKFQKIKIISTGDIFNIYPAFVMPNLIAYTADVEKALLLRKHDVPYSTLVYIFGRNEMFWQRAENAFSSCSIVGTTIKKKSYFRSILSWMKNTQRD
jgi:hypothetical protein